jgi:hypothetical protein
VHAEILELDAGASDQILDRAGDEYVGAPEVRDPRCDVHGDATDVARLQLDLAGVEAAPHYDAEWPHRLGDRRSAAHRAGWSVKGREKPVAKIFDLLSAKPDELLTHRFVVPIEQSAPLAVAHFGGAFGRIDKVGEHHLAKMAETGERAGDGGNQKSPSRSATVIPTLKDLGFKRDRAARWQAAAMLPDADFEVLQNEVLETEDATFTLSIVLRAVKAYVGRQEQLASVEPSVASVVCARWQDWLPGQPDCDLLLTDPPYSTDVNDIDVFAREWLPVALAKVKPTGRAYVCIGAYQRELVAYLTSPRPGHLIAPEVLVWTYRNTLGPTPGHGYKLNWQAILYFCGVDAPPLDCPKMTERFSVQDINAPDGRQHDRWHAWQKPDELCERFVRHASQPGDLVLDPFAGTGSFLLAAASLGRRALGCDESADMVKIAGQRGCLGALPKRPRRRVGANAKARAARTATSGDLLD